MTADRSQRLPLLLAAGFLAIALAGQYAGDTVLGARPSTETADALGRASTSYLTGIRTYASAALWNRIDPLMHGYYSDVSLKDQRYMLSTIALVEWLSPEFAPAYYTGPWILIRNGKVAEGMAMAKRGVEVVPESGICRVSYAQLLLTEEDDLPGAVRQVKAALGEGMHWSDATEQLNGYASMEQILRQADETVLADEVATEIDRIDATVDNLAPSDIHDHNGDGVPDH